jgi:hypothetical protein
VKVGDLVVHCSGSWEGYLFVITDTDCHHGMDDDWIMCQVTIVRTPKPHAEYEVGYTLRWKPLTEWELYKK